MGRQETKIWKYFIKGKKPKSNYTIGRCKFCEAEYISNASRMKKHILKCSKSPKGVKLAVSKIALNSSSSPKTISKKRSKDEITRLDDFLYAAIPEKEKLFLDDLIAQAFLSSGIPFQFIENHYFQEFISHLRPAYKLPGKKSLATILLEGDYNDVDLNERLGEYKLKKKNKKQHRRRSETEVKIEYSSESDDVERELLLETLLGPDNLSSCEDREDNLSSCEDREDNLSFSEDKDNSETTKILMKQKSLKNIFLKKGGTDTKLNTEDHDYHTADTESIMKAGKAQNSLIKDFQNDKGKIEVLFVD